MFHAQDLSKGYGDRTLFEAVSFQLQKSQKMALVGRNGCGKSSLLKLLAGVDTPDSGKITLTKGLQVAYLDQHRDFDQPTVLEQVVYCLPEEYHGLSFRAEQILTGLGLSNQYWPLNPGKLSGGMRLRLALATLLAAEPAVLLLDEPTNHLDLPSSLWLSRFLKSHPSSAIIISHDREFLDSVCNCTAGIFQGKFFLVTGSTQAYFEHLMLTQKASQSLKLKLDKERAKQMVFIERFRAKATKAAQVKSREKRLAKMPTVEEWVISQDLQINIQAADRPVENLIVAKQISFCYCQDTPLIDGLSLEWGGLERFAVVGANGRGKSTLLKLLMGQLKPSSGSVTIHPKANLGYFGQRTIEQLNPTLTPLQTLARESPGLSEQQIRQNLGSFGIQGSMQERPIASFSGGERARVVLAQICSKPTHGLILDEPTHHLDIETVESLMQAINHYEGAVILVTHSLATLESFCPDKLLCFENGSQNWFRGTLDSWISLQLQPQESYVQSQAIQMAAPSPSCYQQEKEAKKQILWLEKQLAAEQQRNEKYEAKISHLYKEIASAHESGSSKQANDLTIEVCALQKALAESTEKWFDIAHILEQNKLELEKLRSS